MNGQARYPQEMRERAVRLVFEHQDEYDSQWAAITSVATKLGMTQETLRFAQEVHELREQAGAALFPLAAAPGRVPEEDSLVQLAAVSPRSAVVEAWRLVESSARRAIEARGAMVEGGRPPTGSQLTRALALAEVLTTRHEA